MIESLSLDQRLRINEIFYSLQGESSSTGCPTVFVRLTGCPLRCGYCDTAYAFTGGTTASLAEILTQVASYDAEYVTVTGGEPLAQKNCLPLLIKLCDAGYRVSLETSGALDISAVDSRVVRVVDIKTPGSGECARNLATNLTVLQPTDELKFVICDRADYEWSRDRVLKEKLHKICMVWFSPTYETCALKDLAEWVLADRLPVRVQCQLHKIIWNDEPGR